MYVVKYTYRYKAVLSNMTTSEPCTLAMFLGQTVRRLRHEAKLSQQELAAKCQLDRSYITLIEQGKKNPTLNIIEKIGSQVTQSSAHFLASVAYDTQKQCGSMCATGQCPLGGRVDYQVDCPTRKLSANIGLLFNMDAVTQIKGVTPSA